MVSVGEFNFGSAASLEYMASQGLPPGRFALKLAEQRDAKRDRNLRRIATLKSKARREKVLKARLQELQAHERTEGGPAYEAGKF